MDRPKDNVNPIVWDVSHVDHHKRQAHEWPELAAISWADDGERAPSSRTRRTTTTTTTTLRTPRRTPEDWAIIQALADASSASSGKGVSLLWNLGVAIRHSESSTKSNFPWRFGPPPQQSNKDKSSTMDTNHDAGTGMGTEESKHAEPLDAAEVFDVVRNIQDPEHPLTLEQLAVVSSGQITVFDNNNGRRDIEVRFTPTIPHCSMATQIGLCIKVKLDRSFPDFRNTVKIEPGTHASEKGINKQLADKERVRAAMENKSMLGIVNKCIANGMSSGTGHIP